MCYMNSLCIPELPVLPLPLDYDCNYVVNVSCVGCFSSPFSDRIFLTSQHAQSSLP